MMNWWKKLIKLNEKLKKGLSFFVQLDAKPDIIKEIPRLAKAGIGDAFLGIETTDETTLKMLNKKHNQPSSYREIAKKFHEHEILVYAGYMIGFSNTSQSSDAILKEARFLSKFFDLIALFRVTPLPGSKDYFEAVQRGEIIDWDPNNYGTNHFVRELKNISAEEMQKIAEKVFSIIHSAKHMVSGAPGLRWQVFLYNFYARIIAEWGKHSIGRPFHFLMDGVPRLTGLCVQRPNNSYRGIPLTVENLENKKAELLCSAVFLQCHINNNMSRIAWFSICE